MAVKGIGLSLGERLVIAGKKYEIVNDVVDVPASVGMLKFIGIDEPEFGTEEVEVNGRVVQERTSEILGYRVTVMNINDKAMDTVTITDMMLADLEALNLKRGDDLELIDPVLTISRMARGNSQLKLFAGGLKKVGGTQSQPAQNQPEGKK